MKKHGRKFWQKILILGGALSLLIFTGTNAQQAGLAPSRVEGPQLMITWQAKTYVPSWFSGKAFPTANSQVTAYVELIDGGKIINLSGQKIYWYVDNELIGAGVGLQKTTFTAPSVPDNIIDLRAEIPSYASSQTNPVLKTVEIPVVNPEVVIESPYPDGQFFSNSIQLNGWPFFFNAQKSSNLNFSWSVNGESSANLENPEFLTLNLNLDAPSGSLININLTIGSPGSLYNTATKGINLTFIK